MKIAGWTDGQGGVYHYRIREPLRGLRLRGHQTTVTQMLSGEAMMGYDLMLVRALNDSHNSLPWEYLHHCEDGPKLVYDLDDDIWAWPEGSPEAKFWNDDRRRQAELNIQMADLVTTPSELLAQELIQIHPNVKILINTVPQWLTKLNQTAKPADRFIVGWEGAEQHIEDMFEIFPSIMRFLLSHAKAELHLWGPNYLAGLDYYPTSVQDRVKFHGWQKDVYSYYRTLEMDVAIAPLQETEFNRTKSGIRVQEHSALGIPIIASNSPAYQQFLWHGGNGFFAHSIEDWEFYLDMLYKDHEMRQTMGAFGRRRAIENWTTEGNSELVEQVYREVCNG
jgi:glycosyltransferase involved in cell wall biosynthesis